MAQIIFYEKPGCINNTRQKKILKESGHTVLDRNLLTEDWTNKPQQLRDFFSDKPVCEWFNRSAPDIQSGKIDPDRIEAEQAITLMLANPLLIRRPLMQIGDLKSAGFDPELIDRFIDRWIGLATSDSKEMLENCPKQQQSNSCHE